MSGSDWGLRLRRHFELFHIVRAGDDREHDGWTLETPGQRNVRALLLDLGDDPWNARALAEFGGLSERGPLTRDQVRDLADDIAERIETRQLNFWSRTLNAGAPIAAKPAEEAVDLADLAAPVAESTETAKTWFEVIFLDETGEAIADIALSMQVDGSAESVTTDGSGKVRRDDAELGSSSVIVSNYEDLRAELETRWTEARDHEWFGPEDLADHTFLPYAEPLPTVQLGAETPQTVVLQPSVSRARLVGALFDSNKCFLLPTAMPSVRQLRALYDAHDGAELLLVGHTDTSGSPSYNDPLSLERAEAVKGYLVDDVDAWLGWYGSDKSAAKRWGDNEDLLMVEAVLSAAGEVPDGEPLEHFQESRGLEVGNADDDTRRQLITEYMSIDGTSLPAGIDPVVHGCGENFPLADDQVELAEAPADGEEDLADRRVELFFFDAPMGILPPPPGDNSAPGSKEYPEWRLRARGTTDLIVRPEPTTITVKGQLFFNRTWDYNDETVPIAAVKELVPRVKVELRIKEAGAAAMTVHATQHLSEQSRFRFTKVPPGAEEAALRIFLEDEGSKITRIVGDSNAHADADFEVKNNAVAWHELPLDVAKLDGSSRVADFEEVEMTKDVFIDLCDCYNSIRFGHARVEELTTEVLPFCEIRYPAVGISYASGGKLFILKDDLKDRDVLLHEYGHFITGKKLPGAPFAGYDYDDGNGTIGQHGPNSQEHYESSWTEAIATFMSCAFSDDPHYHDGYDASLDMYLDSDNTQVGPHCEGSIQEALWDALKVQGVDFKTMWDALIDTSHMTVGTVVDYHDNWKALGLSDLAKLQASYKKFNMEYFYHYRIGGDRFAAVAAPSSYDEAKQEFRTIDELYDAFGKDGSGTLDIYKEEFYNRNLKFNAGSLGAGSSRTDPKIVVGRNYIVPERKKFE